MRRASVVAGLLALLVVISACGSSATGSTPSGGSSSTGQSATASSGAPIKVGLICDCTGTFGPGAVVSADVTRAWAKSVNASGGADGHPVDLIVKDDQSLPANSLTAIQSLISDHVAAVIDDTVLDATWAADIATARIPVLGGDLNNSTFYSNPDFYPSGQTFDHGLTAAVVTAKQAGASSLGMLYCVESPSCQQAVSVVKGIAKTSGVPLTYSGAISATAPNYTAQCVAAEQAHVTALFVADQAQQVATVIGDCDNQNYHPKYVVLASAFTQSVIKSVGSKDQLWTEFPVLPYFAKVSQVEQMDTAVTRYYPAALQDANNFTAGSPAFWTAGLLLQQALTAAKADASTSPTAAVVLTGLDVLDGNTLGGWSPPLTFRAGKTHSVDCWFTGEVVGGQASVVDHGQRTCSA